MEKIRKQYDEEFKKNSVKLSYASPKPVKEIAEDLGIHDNLLYNWRRKYTAQFARRLDVEKESAIEQSLT